jgi:hypothetical protein
MDGVVRRLTVGAYLGGKREVRGEREVTSREREREVTSAVAVPRKLKRGLLDYLLLIPKCGEGEGEGEGERGDKRRCGVSEA